ncbi:MAG: type 4a pilus biogenesis protein PilO, partial [Acidimicrobiia bacterium]
MKRATPFFFMVGAVAVAMAWYLAWWGPTGASISKDRAAATVARSQAAQAQTQVEQLKKFEGRVAELKAKAVALGDRIPKDTNLDTFIQEASVVATRTGVEMVSLTPTQPSANGPAGLTSIGFTMELQGGYPQVRDFLQQITEGDRLVVIDSISLQAGGSDTNAQTLRGSLNGRMFTTAAVGGASANGNAPASPGAAVNSPPASVNPPT